MFDGEWNSGTFEHDPELDGWIDLVGGVKAVDAGYSGTYEITDKSYIFNMNVVGGGYGLLKAMFDPDVLKSVRHIECSYRVYDTSILIGALCLCGPTDRQFVCSSSVNGGYLMAQIGYSQCAPLYDSSIDAFHTYSMAMTGSWPLSNAAYQDSILLDLNSGITSYTQFQSYEPGRLYIPFKQWEENIIEIASIRLYNRNLTPQEVSHNYIVDRERFGF